MMTVGNRLKRRRKELGISAEQLAERLNVNPATVYRYESGSIEKMGVDKLKPIASALLTTPAYLMGWEDETPFPAPSVVEDVAEFYPIGTVAAGYNEIAYENYGADPVYVPVQYLGGRPKTDYFVLTVHGDSMYPAFLDGDKVLVLKQSTLNRSGEVGVILYDGDAATLKKVEYVNGEDWMKLIPINPEYAPKTITGAELERCRVLGVPRLLIRQF